MKRLSATVTDDLDKTGIDYMAYDDHYLYKFFLNRTFDATFKDYLGLTPGFVTIDHEINSNYLSQYFNASLIYGTYPRSNPNYLEVLIPDLLADTLTIYGVTDNYGNIVAGSSYSSVVGKTYRIPFGGVKEFCDYTDTSIAIKIVGVYKTTYKTDLFKFDSVDIQMNYDLFNQGLENVKNTKVLLQPQYYYEVFSLMIVNKTNYQTAISNKSYQMFGAQMYISNLDYTFPTERNYSYAIALDNTKVEDFIIDKLGEDATYEVKYLYGYDSSHVLADDEVILSYKTAFRILNNIDLDESIHIPFETFNQNVLENKLYTVYPQGDEYYTKHYKIVGVANIDTDYNFYFVNTNEIRGLEEIYNKIYCNIFVYSSSLDEAISTMRTLYDVNLVIDTYKGINIRDIAYFFVLFRYIFIAAVLVLLVLLIFILFSYTNSTIKQDSEIIAILRTNGISNKTIFLTYLIQFLYLSFILGVVGILTTIGTTYLANFSIVKGIGYRLVILNVKVLSLAVVFIVGFIITGLAAVIPILKINKLNISAILKNKD